MRAMRRVLVLGALAAALAASRPAHAWVFHDGPAFAQRLAQFTQYLIQFNQMVNGVRTQIDLFRAAYEGLKDWRHLGWVDALQIVESPWFDGVDGIDNIRRAVALTVMSTDQALELWEGLHVDRWLNNPRYKTDPWYRAKVRSLLRQSKRARATRAALLRQMQSQNQALITDVKRIKALRDEIQKANQKTPVDQAKIASLQAEINAIQSKNNGQELMLRNQQAILFLVGEDEAQRSYMETVDRAWMNRNNDQLRELGRAVSR